MDEWNEILKMFPKTLQFLWSDKKLAQYQVLEIRIRCGQPVMILTNEGELLLSSKGKIIDGAGVISDSCEDVYCIDEMNMENLFSYLCRESVYAYLEEMKRGYLTVPGGHRIGVAGEMLSLNEEETAVRKVRYLNIRIAREKRGAADKLMMYLYQNEHFQNTLLIAPPGCGKTTMLRDAIRQISNGNHYAKGMKVSVVDERYELLGNSSHQNSLGIRTDVLSGCFKTRGIMMLLRSMSPEVIAVDEIGGENDKKALEEAMHAGCGLIATMHGDSVYDASMEKKLSAYMEKSMFDRYVFLDRQIHPGRISCVIDGMGHVLWDNALQMRGA